MSYVEQSVSLPVCVECTHIYCFKSRLKGSDDFFSRCELGIILGHCSPLDVISCITTLQANHSSVQADEDYSS